MYMYRVQCAMQCAMLSECFQQGGKVNLFNVQGFQAICVVPALLFCCCIQSLENISAGLFISYSIHTEAHTSWFCTSL